MPAGFLAGRRDGAGVAEGLDDDPADEGVEQAEEPDGDVGGAGDGPVGGAGLFAVDGGGLEADERAEGQGEHAGHSAGGDVGRGEGGQAQAVHAALGQDGGGEQGQDAGFGDEQGAEDLGAAVDGAVAEEPDGGDADPGPGPPGQVNSGEVLGGGGGEVAERAVQADLDGVVGEHGQRGGAEPCGLAEPAGDVGVEGASVADVLAHRGEGDREDGQDRAGYQVAGRGASRLPDDIQIPVLICASIADSARRYGEISRAGRGTARAPVVVSPGPIGLASIGMPAAGCAGGLTGLRAARPRGRRASRNLSAFRTRLVLSGGLPGAVLTSRSRVAGSRPRTLRPGGAAGGCGAGP